MIAVVAFRSTLSVIGRSLGSLVLRSRVKVVWVHSPSVVVPSTIKSFFPWPFAVREASALGVSSALLHPSNATALVVDGSTPTAIMSASPIEVPNPIPPHLLPRTMRVTRMTSSPPSLPMLHRIFIALPRATSVSSQRLVYDAGGAVCPEHFSRMNSFSTPLFVALSEYAVPASPKAHRRRWLLSTMSEVGKRKTTSTSLALSTLLESTSSSLSSLGFPPCSLIPFFTVALPLCWSYLTTAMSALLASISNPTAIHLPRPLTTRVISTYSVPAFFTKRQLNIRSLSREALFAGHTSTKVIGAGVAGTGVAVLPGGAGVSGTGVAMGTTGGPPGEKVGRGGLGVCGTGVERGGLGV
eukprot:Sspe_Gene.18528::Locus_6657_Transcript_1_1_Confidence_1.000_Length_1724::g.18528::m.18528